MLRTDKGWLVEHWQHHSVEIYWAIGLALLFGVPLALWAAIYFETGSGKRLRSWLLSLRSKFTSDRYLLRTEITEAVESNCERVTKETVVRQISKHNALTWSKKYIYTDAKKKYYFHRKLYLFPLLSGEMADFCSEGCTCLFEKLGSNINTSDNFRFLYIEKETNWFFSQELVGEHFGDKIISHAIRRDEKQPTTSNRLGLKYEKGETLKGVRVILLESFVLIPEVLNETISWLQKEGAVVEAVAVLFMGAKEGCANNPCKIGQENVKVAYFADMNVEECLPAASRAKQVKFLTYSDY